MVQTYHRDVIGCFIWSYRRRRKNVLMGRCRYVPRRHLGDVPMRIIGCFIWDLFETSWRCTDGTSSLRPHDTSSRHTNKKSWRCTTETSWQRSTETSLDASFETYLRRHWDVQRDVVKTLPRRLVAGWVFCL